MAIQYRITQTKDRQFFGVYVKSISGESLELLRNTLPELEENHTGAVLLRSDRLARYKKEKDAIRYVEKLGRLTERKQTKKIKHLYLVPIEKDLVIIKPQYHQVHRMTNGKMVKQFTTPNKELAEQTAVNYASGKVATKLVPTVARNLMVTRKELAQFAEGMQLKPQITGGAHKGEFNPNKRIILTKRKS